MKLVNLNIVKKQSYEIGKHGFITFNVENYCTDSEYINIDKIRKILHPQPISVKEKAIAIKEKYGAERFCTIYFDNGDYDIYVYNRTLEMLIKNNLNLIEYL